MAKPIMSSADHKAAIPELSHLIEKKLSEISEMENARCISIDKPASIFGELLGEVFAWDLDEKERLVPYTLGYHLGKFIYCADAAEDYERDARSVSYNPYVLSYCGKPMTAENKATIKCALIHECRGIESAVNLLPFGTRSTIENIIKNVIYLGLPERIKFLDDEPDKNSKQK